MFNEVNFFVAGIPKPQARPKVFHRTLKSGKGFTTTYSPKTNWYSLVYIKALETKNSLKKRLCGALQVVLQFYMPTPKSLSKKKIEKIYYVDKRPDVDNLAKAVMDAINQVGIWEDDSQVADLRIIKAYSKNRFCVEGQPEGCKITIREINQEEY